MPEKPTVVSEVPALPGRPTDGHKGMFGRLLVVGGSEHMLGAPVLAATAALRCGVGLVQAALPTSVLAAALSVTPELVGLALSQSTGADRLAEAARQADALVIGPGMGQARLARLRLQALLAADKPAVLDADALNIIAAGRRWPDGVRLRAVLTPHPGEMARLCPLFDSIGVGPGAAGRQDAALRAARAFGQVILLKGHRTIVTDGRRIYVNQTGDSTLSKAGSGDVLAGIIGCFLAQQMEPFEAACLGAHIHGRCGELAGRELTRRCPLARDVIAQLPAVFRSLER